MRWMKLEPIMQNEGVGNGNLRQYSCLENSMDTGVAKSRTQLSD